LTEQGGNSNLITEQMSIKLFTSYDLKIKKITPCLTSLFLKTDLVKKSNQISMRREILSTYKRKVLSSLDILMIHFYYCPSDPGFFQAIGRI